MKRSSVKILNPAKEVFLPQHKVLQNKAAELLKEYQLDYRDWKFGWTNEKKALGRCFFNKKLITLSRYWVLFLREEEKIDVILHEIAHALTWEQYELDRLQVPIQDWRAMSKAYLAHNLVWQIICKKIGAKPQACYDGEIRLPTGKR